MYNFRQRDQSGDRLQSVDRQPPCNIDLEEEILGGVLLDPAAIERVQALSPSAFYMKAHQLVWRTALDLHAAGKPTDLTTMAVTLAERKILDKVGGQGRLAELVGRTVSAVNIDHYAELLEGMWKRRQLLAIAAEMTEMAFDTATPLPDLLDAATKKVFEVAQQGQKATAMRLGDLLVDRFVEWDARASGKRRPGIACGFYDLDAMTGGYQRGDLIIPAARPSMGKTSFALQTLRNISGFHGLPTVFFSLEMSAESLVDRLASLESQIESGRLRAGRLLEPEWESLGMGVQRLSDIPLYLDDKATTVMQMRTVARQVAAENGGEIGGIVVDYLQLMVSGDDSVRELSRITRELKRLAKELNCPVFALSQLNRGVESRTNKRPMMSDLRECLTRSAMLTLADTGERKSIADIKPGMKVLAVSDRQKIVAAEVSQAFSSGTKPVHRLTTKTGRTIECTENHPILTQRGYVELKDLTRADLIATALNMECPAAFDDDPLKARLLGYLIGNGSFIHGVSFCTPCADVKDDFCELVDRFFPGASFNIENKTGNCWEIDVAYHHVENHGKPFGNTLRNWLRDLGLTGKRAWEKFCPEWVFTLGLKGAAEFLAGLLYTDGSIKQAKNNLFKWSIAFDTSSPVLAVDILQLLARIGVVGLLGEPFTKKQAHHHSMYRVALSEDSGNILRFACMVEKVGRKGCYLNTAIERLTEKDKEFCGRSAFALPKEVSTLINRKSLVLRQQGIKRDPNSVKVWHDQGKRPRREICDRYAKHLQDSELDMWANSDLLWEEVRSIEPIGEEEVFDVTVPETSNFIANGIAVHNCGAIEQDADLIVMLYRDEYYNPDTVDRGLSEIIIVKHRNGPVGTIKLLFEPQFTRFRNLATPGSRSMTPATSRSPIIGLDDSVSSDE